jgi:hypothetical protein
MVRRPGQPGALAKTKADESAADLRQAALSVHLRELATNPMLLTTMAIVHQSQFGLPRERVRLYSQAVDVLLKRRQKHKGGAIAPVGNRASAGFLCQTSVSTGGRAAAPSVSTPSTRRGCGRFCTHSGIIPCETVGMQPAHSAQLQQGCGPIQSVNK